jgi:hypothetical protein
MALFAIAEVLKSVIAHEPLTTSRLGHFLAAIAIEGLNVQPNQACY